jgi:hydrogenase maturation protease
LDGDGRDAVILVDAAPRGGPAGALYVIQPDPNELMPPPARAMDGIEPHALDPLRVLRLAWALGARPKHVRIVGCEPAPVAPDDADAGCQGLSEPVRLALDEAVGLVEATIAELARMELRERPHA